MSVKIPVVSVIIPTYNRKDSVLRALLSLCHQTLPAQAYEVIVVDDGSSYPLEEVAGQSLPYTMRFVRQSNQGATVARNNGAQLSKGQVLVFMDDDVTVDPTALEFLADACRRESLMLAMGTLEARSPKLWQSGTKDRTASNSSLPDRYLHFSETNTQLLAMRRVDFFDLGMLEDPTGGWPNWDDVDFGYRAHLSGFRLLQCGKATGIHWDYALSDLRTACRRWYRASKSAVRLFQRHPGLEASIPMYNDKTPISWQHDQPRLIIRKMARRLLSIAPITWTFEQVVGFFERRHLSSFIASLVVNRLSIWVCGAYMYRGLRDGLQEYGSFALSSKELPMNR